MNLQQVIDTIAAEIAAIKKRAEGDAHYIRGATDTLERIVALVNTAEQKESVPEDGQPDAPKE